MAYRVVEDVFVVVHGKADPGDDEWAEYLRYCREEVPGETSTLVVTDGGGPSTNQRALMNDWLGESNPKVVICTDVRIVRGIVTALSWFNKNIRSFSKDQIDEALQHLGAAAATRKAVPAIIPGLEARISA